MDKIKALEKKCPVYTDEELSALEVNAGMLQQRIKELGIPVMVLFEGWGASGKGEAIRSLINTLDPRGFKVHVIRQPDDYDSRFPVMRRFWNASPAKGQISIFDRSWYREVSNALFEREDAKKSVLTRYDEILDFENQMIAAGVVIIKFFLNVKESVQKERLNELSSSKSTSWRVSSDDWEQNNHYAEYEEVFSEMIKRTDMSESEWFVLNSKKRKDVRFMVLSIFTSALEKAIQRKSDGYDPAASTRLILAPLKTAKIEKIECVKVDQKMDEKAYHKELKACTERLGALHNILYKRKIPMVLGFEGWDAAGKGGAIKRLTRSLDPRGCTVMPVASPTPTEKAHHHLWRFYENLPKNGHVEIYDRTWYGRVMVERIEGFCTEAEWKRAYEEINRFEKSLVDYGTIVCKFWLQITNDEQLRRFTDRQNTPEKQWKITDEDWRNREKWDEYAICVNEMLKKTNTKAAPWVIVEANNKYYARIKVMKTVIKLIEERLEKAD